VPGQRTTAICLGETVHSQRISTGPNLLVWPAFESIWTDIDDIDPTAPVDPDFV
jgi:hypothetical protein